MKNSKNRSHKRLFLKRQLLTKKQWETEKEDILKKASEYDEKHDGISMSNDPDKEESPMSPFKNR